MPTAYATWRVPGYTLILMTVILMLLNAGCSKRQSKGDDEIAPDKLFVPQVDNVPVSVRDVKLVEKARFLVAVEEGMQDRFPNAKCSRSPDETLSPGWVEYELETDEGKISLNIFFASSAKAAAQQLQALDLTVNVRENIQATPGIGDEAYEYGPTGMLLARYSNILVKVSLTGSDQRQQVAKFVFKAIDKIVKKKSAP